jgi:hypothetical protein
MGVNELTTEEQQFLYAALGHHRQRFLSAEFVNALNLSSDVIPSLKQKKLLKITDVWAKLTMKGVKLAQDVAEVFIAREAEEKRKNRFARFRKHFASFVRGFFIFIFCPVLASLLAAYLIYTITQFATATASPAVSPTNTSIVSVEK